YKLRRLKMYRKFKIFTALTLSVLILLFIAKIILFDLSNISEKTSYEIDLDNIRQLASADVKELPIHINSLVVSEFSYPASIAVAGDGLFKNYRLITPLYQIIYRDKSILIDTGIDEKNHQKYFSKFPFYKEKFNKAVKAMEKADKILLTHEHMDHIGGLGGLPGIENFTKYSKIIITEEQLNSRVFKDVILPQEFKENLIPVKYDKYYSPASGIVFIKAAGHTPGSQMIYVQLADNSEFIFVGDVVWHNNSIKNLKERANLVKHAFLKEDVSAVQGQIRALHNLIYIQKERINLVISHDSDQYNNYIREGILKEGLE
ncbi:MAG: MBL fold metallo-hydrolase, partial [Actinomycetia bacterium]|nr:MBL fold metallo-hydrolase [Actinomycetes bacterium]